MCQLPKRDVRPINICFVIISEKAKLVASIHHIRQLEKTEIISQQQLKKYTWNDLIEVGDKNLF